MGLEGTEAMRNWLRRGKVTAETARRITGISLPFGGLSWADPGPSDAEVVRQFLVFLEDRRALYNPMQLEVFGDVERSIHQIREQCTRTLQQLGPDAFAVGPLRAIREAGRRFSEHDVRALVVAARKAKSDLLAIIADVDAKVAKRRDELNRSLSDLGTAARLQAIEAAASTLKITLKNESNPTRVELLRAIARMSAATGTSCRQIFRTP